MTIYICIYIYAKTQTKTVWCALISEKDELMTTNVLKFHLGKYQPNKYNEGS